MPWLTLLIAVISYFLAKKSGASTGEALAVGAVAGAGTYAVTHYTDWGKTNLGSLDGVVPTTATDAAIASGATPAAASTATGTSLIPSIAAGGTAAGTTGLSSTLTGLLPTLAVAGAGAVAGSALTSSIPSWVWWVGGGFLVYELVKGE